MPRRIPQPPHGSKKTNIENMGIILSIIALVLNVVLIVRLTIDYERLKRIDKRLEQFENKDK